MLELKDFFHLPEVDALFEQLAADGPGLIVVAGLDPRPLDPSPARDGFLPSGRSAIFRILMRRILAAQRRPQAIVVAEDKSVVRIPRKLRRQVKLRLVEPPMTYAGRIAEAASRQPGLLVIDRLCAETAPGALSAAQRGLRVLSQLDTVFRGENVARHLLDLGASQGLLGGLKWVVAVHRLATLCPRCKQPAPPDAAQLAELHRRYPTLDDLVQDATFFKATGCPDCDHSGRAGDVIAFDVLSVDSGFPRGTSALSLETYVLRLAALGHLPLDDALRIEVDQLHRTYNLLTASERARADVNAGLQRKLAQLEAANRVLQRRTKALISLQDIGQALIASSGLDDLAARVCRHARELCGADRAILYYLKHDTASVLAVSGWDPALLHQELDATMVFGASAGHEPTPYAHWPPGVTPHQPDEEKVVLRTGLRVPLIAQGQRVGLMIVHSIHKSRFAQGEVALLQTFANQAALAIQRAGLIETLREKIVQLETAQAKLLEKERMEREMELARQVQQSVLPRVFPRVPGYTFAACNRPARRVGGDFYDVISLDAHRFGLVIADVSDKGMPAALYMALTRSLLLAESRRETSPRAVLTNVHRLLLELGEPDMFVTVFYGVVDGSARRLTYVRAGHDRPLLLRQGVVQPLSGDGTFLGFPDLDDLHLTEERIDLVPGDRLALYTDGLTDVLSPDGQFFGLSRLESLLQSHAGLPPEELCAFTFAELDAYQGDAEQYDDMTMLVVEVQ